MNVVREIDRLNKYELERGITVGKGSWHDTYADSKWIFASNFSYDLTEGDLVCIFSQFGRIVDIDLARDKEGKSKGFCFLCYDKQLSTVLAVDNFNGAKIAERIIRVDHVKEYKKKKRKVQNGNESETDEEWLREEEMKKKALKLI